MGISRLILKELNESIEIFIVEMGEYYSDDIKKISLITPPQISVITGINEAHLESYENHEKYYKIYLQLLKT